MQYQTFSGDDLKEALSAVRSAYGPDALIGPTRHVQMTDQAGIARLRVEVQAAPSSPRASWPFSSGITSDAPAPAARPKKRILPRSQKPGFRAETPSERAVQARPSSSLSQMEAQIAELKTMVEALQSQLPAKNRALSLLSRIGIEGLVARQLGSRLGKAKTDDEILSRLAQRLARSMKDPENLLCTSHPELIACVGPTGVGKTTTLAKMAAQARLEFGKSVAVISLDHFRVGAAGQWQRYGKLMKIPVFSPKSPDELEEILAENPADLLLVDTPSLGSTQDSSMKSFASLAHKSRRRTHVLMLLPAWLRGNDAEALISRYEHLSPTGICATKMDETAGLGGVIQAAIAQELPISYLCQGPRVPEHLEFAEKDQVLRLAFLQGERAVH